MNIALVGFGKMGHMLARRAIENGHTVCLTVDPSSSEADLKTSSPAEMAAAVRESGAQGIIEFTHPSSVLGNLRALVPTGIPIVVGTTGWHDHIGEIERLAIETGGYLLYASNFSIGINLFYRLVSEAARLFSDFSYYDVAVVEEHHNQKVDSPSGTALDIARLILKNCPRKDELVTNRFDRAPLPNELHVASVRAGHIPGTHTVLFDSSADTIELTHRARNREGLAAGAVHALEWLVDCQHPSDPAHNSMTCPRKPGVFTMDDVLASL